MDNRELIEHFNARAPGFFKMLGGEVVALDPRQPSCTMAFNISHDFCHSVDVVQGGFITAMLDAAMSHAVFAAGDGITGVSSLEIKTSYTAPTRAGVLRAEGRVVKSGYKIAFLEGALYNQKGELTATSSSVAKLVRAD
jgi:uncharacterized protein (TIGR00369 family)